MSSDDNCVRTAFVGSQSALTTNTIQPYPPDKKQAKKRLVRLLLTLYYERNKWRKYGRLRTFCNETIILAPVKKWWWMAQLFLIFTSVLFVYEFFYHNWIVLLPVVTIAFLQLLSFYKTCMRDPGILPRSDVATAMRNLLGAMSLWERGSGFGPVSRVLTHPNGVNEQMTYCWKCHHYRPLTTSHCGVCDCCMQRHDHHCPVYGGCVAKNNLCAFHVMVATMAGFWLYVSGYCLYNFVTADTVDTVDITKRDELVAARVTFYLVLCEIGAVAVIPSIIEFCQKKRPKHEVPAELTISRKTLLELLEFAHKNNFSIEEENRIKQLFEADLGTSGSNGNSRLQDVNHNKFSLETV